MRKKLIAGNWKMNHTIQTGLEMIQNLKEKIQNKNAEILICPSFLAISSLQEKVIGSPIQIGAQNCADRVNGAFTGEVSVSMLRACNLKYVIIGHSERRMIFHETDEIIKTKIDLAIEGNLSPIFCCGESKDIRIDNRQENFVEQQLFNSLFHLSEENMLKICIAYEPIWAIGTGLNASAAQAEEMHEFIRNKIKIQYGESISSQIRILYGGSLKPENAVELLSQPNVDGGLIGGASLKAEDFAAIVNAIN